MGAVIVDPKTEEVIAVGANGPIGAHDPTAHAEIVALRQAAAKLGNYRLTDLTLVVTLEPCAMCAGAISHARIGRVVWGADDPKGGAVIHGPRVFDQPTCHHRPEVEGGLLALERGDCAMVTYNLAERGEQAVLDHAATHGKGILIKKALASGHAVLAGEDPVRASFELVFGHPGVTAAIVGTINPQHLAANAATAAAVIRG